MLFMYHRALVQYCLVHLFVFTRQFIISDGEKILF